MYFLDFEDSYSYNIIADIFEFSKVRLKVIPLQEHKEFFNNFKNHHVHINAVVILGPGPHSPQNYPYQWNAVKEILSLKGSTKFLGICLGHQMLLEIMGLDIRESRNPLHGQSISLELTPWWKKFFKTEKNELVVQRYNSLAVNGQELKDLKNYLCKEDEIMLFTNDRIFSMQFHPESIGTQDKAIIFNAIDRFIKN